MQVPGRSRETPSEALGEARGEVLDGGSSVIFSGGHT